VVPNLRLAASDEREHRNGQLMFCVSLFSSITVLLGLIYRRTLMVLPK
jgi:hypothetical protein